MTARPVELGPSPIDHGGRVYEAARRWGINPDQILDFSANINPLGPPHGVLAAIENALTPVNLRAYPDSHAFASAIADKYQLSPGEIVVGSGTASLIFAVLHALSPKRVLTLEPAFIEYSRACAAVKAQMRPWLLTEDNGFIPNFASLVHAVKRRQFDLVILNSPQNPTGVLYPRDSLLPLIDEAEEHDVAILLDEAFIDYVSQGSLVSLAPTKSHLIVLRSLTKFYAMPGIRIGYAVSNAELGARIRNQIDPWSVSTVGLEAGCAAVADDEFEVESCLVNASTREEFAGALRRIGLEVLPSAGNFLLAKLPRASAGDLQRCLESERILIRCCDSFRGLGDAYIRLAVLGRPDNLRLVSLIGNWLTGN